MVALQKKQDELSQITSVLRQIFLQGLGGRIQKMESALQSEDWVEVGELAHQLKGTAGCFGVLKLQIYAANIEAAASRADSSSCRDILTEIRFSFMKS